MTAILPQDILVYAGGDAWARYGTYTRRVARIGRNGESGKETVSRPDAATCATYVGRDGLVHRAAANVLRGHWLDTNGDGVVDTLVSRHEKTATNQCLQSDALGTSPWTQSHQAVTNGVTGPDGSTLVCKLVPDTTSSNLHYTVQSTTITAGEFLAAQVKLARAGYTGVVVRCTDSPGSNSFGVVIDLTAGTLTSTTSGAGVLTGSAVRAVPGGGYEVRIWGAINAGLTTGILQVWVFDTAADALSRTAYVGDGTSGVYAWNVGLERNGTAPLPPTSYIATTTTAVTRADDRVSVPIGFAPQALTAYVKLYEAGAIADTTQRFAAALGTLNSANAPRLQIDNNAGAGKYRLIHNNNVSSVSAVAAAAPSLGQLTELRAVLNADGSIYLGQSIAGAAESVTATSSPLALAAAWNAQDLLIGCTTSTGNGAPLQLQRLLIVKGVHTLAELQAVP